MDSKLSSSAMYAKLTELGYSRDLILQCAGYAMNNQERNRRKLEANTCREDTRDALQQFLKEREPAAFYAMQGREEPRTAPRRPTAAATRHAHLASDLDGDESQKAARATADQRPALHSAVASAARSTGHAHWTFDLRGKLMMGQATPPCPHSPPTHVSGDAMLAEDASTLVHATTVEAAQRIMQTFVQHADAATVVLNGHNHRDEEFRDMGPLVWTGVPGAMTPDATTYFANQYGRVVFRFTKPRTAFGYCKSVLREYPVELSSTVVATQQCEVPLFIAKRLAATWPVPDCSATRKHHCEIAFQGAQVTFELQSVSLLPHWYLRGHPYWRCVRSHKGEACSDCSNREVNDYNECRQAVAAKLVDTVPVAMEHVPPTCLCRQDATDVCRKCKYSVCASCSVTPDAASGPLCCYCAPRIEAACGHRRVSWAFCARCRRTALGTCQDCEAAATCCCTDREGEAETWLEKVRDEDAKLHIEQIATANALFDRVATKFRGFDAFTDVCFALHVPSMDSLRKQLQQRIDATGIAAQRLGWRAFARHMKDLNVRASVGRAANEAWAAFFEEAAAQPNKLFVVLQDEAHVGRKEGSLSLNNVVTPSKKLDNVLHVMISATPYSYAYGVPAPNIQVWFPPSAYVGRATLQRHGNWRVCAGACVQTKDGKCNVTQEVSNLCLRYEEWLRTPNFREEIAGKLVVIRAPKRTKGKPTNFAGTIARRLRAAAGNGAVVDASGDDAKQFNMGTIDRAVIFVILVSRYTMGDTFPKNVAVYDESLKFHTEQSRSNIECMHQEFGRAFGYRDVTMQVYVCEAANTAYRVPCDVDELATMREEGYRLSNTARSPLNASNREAAAVAATLSEADDDDESGRDSPEPQPPSPSSARDHTSTAPTDCDIANYVDWQRFALWAQPQCGKTGVMLWFMNRIVAHVARARESPQHAAQ